MCVCVLYCSMCVCVLCMCACVCVCVLYSMCLCLCGCVCVCMLSMSFPYTVYVNPPVWCRDLASCTSRDQETEDVSNSVPARHPWTHTVGQAKKCRHLEAGRGSTHEGAAEVKTTTWARPCAADA